MGAHILQVHVRFRTQTNVPVHHTSYIHMMYVCMYVCMSIHSHTCTVKFVNRTVHNICMYPVHEASHSHTHDIHEVHMTYITTS